MEPTHKQQQGQKSSVGSLGGGGPAVGPSLSMPPLTTGAGDTFVVLYDYAAQRGDEIQLAAGQLIQVLDTSERDWWKVRALDGSNRIGYFPSSYLAQLYPNERPLQVAQTIQVSNGETCDKLLRGQVMCGQRKQSRASAGADYSRRPLAIRLFACIISTRPASTPPRGP